ncbi:unnamed protein product [Pseudo-nitzschia multistriata]|uniref:Uncharacterized protein n=1 Tax=Pseudo-nitzschia multistriata TaxID=183589 RepID=A0A448ZHR8_9STRA|nr:unnamed protein product [Pseudo-nitzschia multistriata]
MDVNLSDEPIREGPNGEPYSPGAGGWPTVRYFNRETGIAGGAYAKKTDGPMCQELGNEDYMVEYVEGYGKTFRCRAPSGEGCDEREAGYIAKMSERTGAELVSELERLESMEGSSMAPDLEKWLRKRQKILGQLTAAPAEGGSDEL